MKNTVNILLALTLVGVLLVLYPFSFEIKQYPRFLVFFVAIYVFYKSGKILKTNLEVNAKLLKILRLLSLGYLVVALLYVVLLGWLYYMMPSGMFGLGSGRSERSVGEFLLFVLRSIDRLHLLF
jgi:hypothetical protein